jgi:hypothetical protein
LAGSQKVVLDLVTDGIQGISVDKAKVSEEDTHEDGAPEELINGNLGEDGNGVSPRDLLIEPVVEVMSRGTVVDETEERESCETFPINGASSNKDLRDVNETCEASIHETNNYFNCRCTRSETNGSKSINTNHCDVMAVKFSPERANLQGTSQQEKSSPS